MKNLHFNYDFIDKVQERQSVVEQLIHDEEILSEAQLLHEKCHNCFFNGNKLIFCGNGGSAADCQHIAAEFIVKLSKIRRALPAISLTSNTSVITAISNDIDYESVFIRQLEGIAKPRDILIGISTSGNSQNIINSFQYAREHDIYTVSVTGNNKSELWCLADTRLIIPSKNTQIIQEVYLMIFHIMCEKLEELYE